jgi:hypothetical protein
MTNPQGIAELVANTPDLTSVRGDDLYPPALCNWITTASDALEQQAREIANLVVDVDYLKGCARRLQAENATLNAALDAKIDICGDERITALKAENAKFRELLEGGVEHCTWLLSEKGKLEDKLTGLENFCAEVEIELVGTQTKLAEAEKDAARYCYLRANTDFQIEFTGELTLDEHVDAAILGAKP